MRHSLGLLLAAACVCALAACASAPDANYTRYGDMLAEQEAARAARFESIARTADKCTDDACVQMVAAIAALSQAAGGQTPPPEQYRRQASAWERFGLAALGALPGLGQVYASIRAGDANVDIARIGADREIAVTQAWAGTTTGVANAFGTAFTGLPPTTAVQVGGDYITGTQHVGDAVGRDQIAGNQHIGDAVGADQIGGDRIDGSAIGDGNRIGSPGPYETGDRCTGPTCQGTNNPPPDPAPDPAPDPTPDPEG